ncbi:MAG: hypothetical protein WCO55_03680 [Candidatus Falkowbacteria bacterium]
MKKGKEKTDGATITVTPDTTATVTTAAPIVNNLAWNDRIGKFAAAVGKDINEVNAALESLVGEPVDEALQYLDNAESTPDSDIKDALKELKIPSAKINMHLKLLRSEKAATDNGATVTGGVSQASYSVLPQLPDEASFLESLKIGGISKVSQADILSAVVAALANSVDIYDVPEKILVKMEEYAKTLDEPVKEDYYEMEKMITKQKYGDVLTALNLTSNYVTEKKKNELLGNLDTILWPALHSFQSQLSAWQDSWVKSLNNPGMMVAIMTGGMSGVKMPSGLMEAPDTASIRAAGEEVINKINKIFAGTGIPVARALAHNATRIMGLLNNPSLPVQINAPNKDVMLKMLGISVGAEIVRTEQSLKRYTMSILQLNSIGPDIEHMYLSSLCQLGATIAWDNFNTTPGTRAGIGVNVNRYKQ